MRDERTLTERVERVENILAYSGFGSDENSMCDRAVTGQRHVSEDKLERHTDRAQPATSFDEIVGRIQTSTDRMCVIASKLEEIGNRVFGTLPEQSEGIGTDARKPDGTLEHTFIALNYLDNTLCRLHEAAARLECV